MYKNVIASPDVVKMLGRTATQQQVAAHKSRLDEHQALSSDEKRIWQDLKRTEKRSK